LLSVLQTTGPLHRRYVFEAESPWQIVGVGAEPLQLPLGTLAGWIGSTGWEPTSQIQPQHYFLSAQACLGRVLANAHASGTPRRAACHVRGFLVLWRRLRRVGIRFHNQHSLAGQQDCRVVLRQGPDEQLLRRERHDSVF